MVTFQQPYQPKWVIFIFKYSDLNDFLRVFISSSAFLDNKWHSFHKVLGIQWCRFLILKIRKIRFHFFTLILSSYVCLNRYNANFVMKNNRHDHIDFKNRTIDMQINKGVIMANVTDGDGFHKDFQGALEHVFSKDAPKSYKMTTNHKWRDNQP